jgi:hypothetical protein
MALPGIAHRIDARDAPQRRRRNGSATNASNV